MKLRNCSFREFEDRIRNKTLICFGCGNYFDEMMKYCSGKWEILKNCTFICDNDEKKWGSKKRCFDQEIQIISVEELEKLDCNKIVLLLTLAKFREVVDQLDQMEVFDQLEAYIYPFMKVMQNEEIEAGPGMPEGILGIGEEQIPPIIHYTWFSGEELPEGMKQCLESWKKYCPDYEIKRWSAENYDVEKNEFAYEAYKAKKWGFVGDYARLDIIYNEGGIYLDLDVEVLKNLDDLRKNQAFLSFQSPDIINPGSGFGAVKHHPLIKAMRDEYNNLTFFKDHMNKNEPGPIIQTKTLKQFGLRCDGSYQMVGDMAVYPRDVLCVKSWETGLCRKTDFSYAIHHYAGTWLEVEVKQICEDSLFQRSMLYEEFVFDR